jgi:putative oxidoreductase
MKLWAKFTEEAYSLLRIVAGFMILMHGMQKILGVFAEQQPAVGSQIWIGGLIELIGGLLIFFGFQTRCAAFIASGMLAVAYFQFHWKFQFDSHFFPIVNHGELAVLYCFVFLFIATKGGGKWSVDGIKG